MSSTCFSPSSYAIYLAEQHLTVQQGDNLFKKGGKIFAKAVADSALTVAALLETVVLAVLTAIASPLNLFSKNASIYKSLADRSSIAAHATINAAKGIFQHSSSQKEEIKREPTSTLTNFEHIRALSSRVAQRCQALGKSGLNYFSGKSTNADMGKVICVAAALALLYYYQVPLFKAFNPFGNHRMRNPFLPVMPSKFPIEISAVNLAAPLVSECLPQGSIVSPRWTTDTSSFLQPVIRQICPNEMGSLERVTDSLAKPLANPQFLQMQPFSSIKQSSSLIAEYLSQNSTVSPMYSAETGALESPRGLIASQLSIPRSFEMQPSSVVTEWLPHESMVPPKCPADTSALESPSSSIANQLSIPHSLEMQPLSKVIPSDENQLLPSVKEKLPVCGWRNFSRTVPNTPKSSLIDSSQLQENFSEGSSNGFNWLAFMGKTVHAISTSSLIYSVQILKHFCENKAYDIDWHPFVAAAIAIGSFSFYGSYKSQSTKPLPNFRSLNDKFTVPKTVASIFGAALAGHVALSFHNERGNLAASLLFSSIGGIAATKLYFMGAV